MYLCTMYFYPQPNSVVLYILWRELTICIAHCAQSLSSCMYVDYVYTPIVKPIYIPDVNFLHIPDVNSVWISIVNCAYFPL
jgi:hypothetical protein